MPHADALTPPPEAPPAGALRFRPGGLAGRAVVRLHALVDRLDQTPAEFGRDRPVDTANPNEVAAEWLRLLRRWAAYNPEEVFAMKVGTAMLLLALAGLWVGISVFF